MDLIVMANNSVGPTLNVERSQTNVAEGFTNTVGLTGGSLSEPTKRKRGRPRKPPPFPSSSREPIKRKRGRPRKYRPDGSGLGVVSGSGSVALGLSPSSLNRDLGPRGRREEGLPGLGGSSGCPLLNETDSPEETNAYSFDMPKGLYPILEAITNKYGDITENFTLKSTYGNYIKSTLLEGICKIVLKIQNFPPADLKSDDIAECYKIIEDAESVKFDVNWLRQYLDNMVKAMEKVDEVEEIKEAEQKKVERENAVKMKKVEKRKIELEIEQLEEQLTIDNRTIEEMRIQINRVLIASLAPII